MLRAIGGLCCLYGHGAPQLPLQGSNAPSVPSAVPSINHNSVHQSPIAPPDFVRDVPAANSLNGIGFKVYSFGGDLPHALRGDAPADLHIEHGEMVRAEITGYIARTRIEGDREVETTRLKFSSQRMYSFDFTPCIPVFSYYPPVVGKNSGNEVPMALYHAENFVPEMLDGLLASAEHGHPTDIFVVTRNFPPENSELMRTRKQSATALYVHANLPEGTRFHVIEVPVAQVSVRVAADKIEVWKTRDEDIY